MSCNRTIIRTVWERDPWTGETVESIVEERECRTRDVSLHSYVCDACGEKFWYSTRGKIAELHGVDVMDVRIKDD